MLTAGKPAYRLRHTHLEARRKALGSSPRTRGYLSFTKALELCTDMWLSPLQMMLLEWWLKECIRITVYDSREHLCPSAKYVRGPMLEEADCMKVAIIVNVGLVKFWAH